MHLERRLVTTVAHFIHQQHGHLHHLYITPAQPFSSSSHVVQKTKEQGGGKQCGRKNETLTFSGDCRSSLVGVSGLPPSLVLRFFLVSAVAPRLFFCWYSFSCENKEQSIVQTEYDFYEYNVKKKTKLQWVERQIKSKDKRNTLQWVCPSGEKKKTAKQVQRSIK